MSCLLHFVYGRVCLEVFGVFTERNRIAQGMIIDFNRVCLLNSVCWWTLGHIVRLNTISIVVSIKRQLLFLFITRPRYIDRKQRIRVVSLQSDFSLLEHFET